MYFYPAGVYSGEDVKKIRRHHGMSQTDLAAYLNVSVKTVEAWECGTRNPSGPVCRLLDLLKESVAGRPQSKDSESGDLGNEKSDPEETGNEKSGINQYSGIPFSKKQHYLHRHSFMVKEYGIPAVWLDIHGTLWIKFSIDTERIRIPFFQGLPDHREMEKYHEMVGCVFVQEYVRKKGLEKRIKAYVERLNRKKGLGQYAGEPGES